MTESAGLFYTLSLVIYVASGTVFPLTIFGDALARLFIVLLFSYTVFFPVNALTGKLTMLEAAKGIGVQWLWIAVLAVVSRWV
ncbi:hypothetical protein ACFQ5D_11260 [Paenibacillus farraposensis]|uniref:Uncharacterized protein n=1 Tax=Paenibacillus farraposensis TaxID=2807095 RepID=A0ABW4DDZ0_9BACL|nr:hypothetical protein [Paenibacillus farraposensis]